MILPPPCVRALFSGPKTISGLYHSQHHHYHHHRHHPSFSTTRREGAVIINTLTCNFDWSNRIGCQDRFSLQEKGWQVAVDWRHTPFGAGLFAAQDIAKGTILRRGIFGVNLMKFTSIADIDDFCNLDPFSEKDRRDYVKDYLWGFTFSRYTDDDGYALDENADVEDLHGTRRIYAMWVPGNGLNHSREPNTIYVESNDGIDLVALADLSSGTELYDDYRRHGLAPEWLKTFAQIHNVTLNFADCNDFVGN